MLIQTAAWRWPQWFMFVIFFVGIAMAMAEHGKKVEEHGGSAVIGTIIGILVIAAGGFFRSFGLPQIIYLVIESLGTGLAVRSHGLERKKNAAWSIVGSVVAYAILIWGGFFK